MLIEIAEASAGDAPLLRNLMQLYLYEFSEIEGLDVDEQGLFHYFHLDDYWRDANRHPFLARVDGRLAGFALVTHVMESEFDGAETYEVSEFFVLRKYRRRGAGTAMARRLFDLFPGCWEVRELAQNLPAHAFWRKVIGDYTRGSYQETIRDDDRWRGPIQTFDTTRL